MALTPGSRLGVYEITAQIGEGGMGAVYRATDTSLSRAVAIKVLPDAFAQDAERLARFEREAKTLAALNHPNIAAIYGLERSSGTLALVMELVEGDDLSQRIAKGAIPLDEALPIAKQIAEALEAAHEQGIVHRDLKPANIKVRPDGTVKVLDFGLAKAMEPAAGSSPSMSMSPTITTPAMTQAGTILGTAAYMSPEQAKGRSVDKRSDVWAFGAVLYEMLTGTRAFTGDDVSEVLASVLARDPDWSRLPATLSPALSTYIRRCLNKNPKQRIGDVQDVRLALEGAFETAASPATSTTTAASRGRRRPLWRSAERLAWLLACAVLVSAVVYEWRSTRRVGSTGPAARFRIEPPPGEVFPGAGGTPRFAVSPDGRYLLYSSMLVGQHEQLWLHSLDSDTEQPLPATLSKELAGETVNSPFWSPDSRSIGYFDNSARQLKRVDIGRDVPQVVTQLDYFQNAGGSWNTDGVIIVGYTGGAGIKRVSAAGGQLESVTQLDTARHELDHVYPQFLPDGRHFLFTATRSGTSSRSDVYLGSLDSPERVLLTESDGAAAFAGPNLVLYLRGVSLVAQPLDLKRMSLAGTPTVVAPAIRRPNNRRLPVSSSTSGVLAFAEAGVSSDAYRAVWLDRNGAEIRGLPELTMGVNSMRLSPDGHRIAFTRAGNVWIQDLARGVQSQFTSGDGPSGNPVWSPDGAQLAFQGARGPSQTQGIFRKPVDSPAPEQSLVDGVPAGRLFIPLDWSADGRTLVVDDQPLTAQIPTPTAGVELKTVSTEGRSKPVSYLPTPRGAGQARVSPDGRWLAYESNESGTPQIVLQSFPDPRRFRRQISPGNGLSPRWRTDGKELFYLDGRFQVVAVPMSLGDPPETGEPRALFAAAPGPSYSGFEVTGDGQRFAFVQNLGGNPITVIVNWTPSITR